MDLDISGPIASIVTIAPWSARSLQASSSAKSSRGSRFPLNPQIRLRRTISSSNSARPLDRFPGSISVAKAIGNRTNNSPIAASDSPSKGIGGHEGCVASVGFTGALDP